MLDEIRVRVRGVDDQVAEQPGQPGRDDVVEAHRVRRLRRFATARAASPSARRA